MSLMNSFAASPHRRRICLLEFAIVLPSGEMQRLQMNSPRECGLISLINSYLVFPFLIFYDNVTAIRCILVRAKL